MFYYGTYYFDILTNCNQNFLFGRYLTIFSLLCVNICEYYVLNNFFIEFIQRCSNPLHSLMSSSCIFRNPLPLGKKKEISYIPIFFPKKFFFCPLPPNLLWMNHSPDSDRALLKLLLNQRLASEKINYLQ